MIPFNFRQPEWTPDELELIRRSWSVEEAWSEYSKEFRKIVGKGNWGPVTRPWRSRDAVKRCWMRCHPKFAETDLRLKVALDKMEAETA